MFEHAAPVPTKTAGFRRHNGTWIAIDILHKCLLECGLRIFLVYHQGHVTSADPCSILIAADAPAASQHHKGLMHRLHSLSLHGQGIACDPQCDAQSGAQEGMQECTAAAEGECQQHPAWRGLNLVQLLQQLGWGQPKMMLLDGPRGR